MHTPLIISSVLPPQKWGNFVTHNSPLLLLAPFSLSLWTQKQPIFPFRLELMGAKNYFITREKERQSKKHSKHSTYCTGVFITRIRKLIDKSIAKLMYCTVHSRFCKVLIRFLSLWLPLQKKNCLRDLGPHQESEIES